MMIMLMSGLMLWMLIILLSFIYCYMMIFNKIIIIDWLIYTNNSMNLKMCFYMDDLSIIFLIMVSLITSLVIFYSIEYMELDKMKLKRFNYLVILFMMSMFLFISSMEMLSILVGWDLLGLSSYCLVIYYQNYKSLNAGFLTIMLNRIGDCMLLMIISIKLINGSMNNFYDFNYIMMIMLMIMGFTKSAQLPFSSWLPAAMMAPTPVSALVHSSTLVTAGVYLLIRLGMNISVEINNYFLLISSMTMLLSGLMANFESDIKKIIALSTLSQLGFMMSILMLKMYDLVFLHLIIHAMFKSLMFLCVGSFIHYLKGSQDLRDFMGMYYIYPMKGFIMMFSIFSLCGFPFLSGYYSKDLIMEMFFNNQINWLILINLCFGTLFTVSYSSRLILVLFKFNLKDKSMMIEENKWMNYYMMIMILMTIFFSYYFLSIKFLIYNINMSLIFKFLVLKICMIGLLFSLMMLNIYKMLNKNLLYYFKKMFYLNKNYKYLFMWLLMNIFKYDIYFEKMNFNLFNKYLYMNFNNIIKQEIYSTKFYHLMILWILIIMLMIMLY